MRGSRGVLHRHSLCFGKIILDRVSGGLRWGRGKGQRPGPGRHWRFVLWAVVKEPGITALEASKEACPGAQTSGKKVSAERGGADTCQRT